MSIIDNAKQLCMERDAGRCRHCGTTKELDVCQLVKREGRLAWHLSNLITQCWDCKALAATPKSPNRVGVMLCGGRGTRLYPLTMFQNKHTLPIGLIPMALYPIKTLQWFGVSRVLVVTDREGTNETMKMLGSGKEFGIDISYKVQEGAGGISEALYLAKDFAKPTDEIVCILGDNVFDNSKLETNINLTSDGDKACVYVKEVSNPEDYGVAELEADMVKKIVEKPKTPVSNMAVVGLYVYTYDVFNVIESVVPSERGELEISSVNNMYAQQGSLQFRTVKGYWGDAGGSIQRYAECSMHGAKEANVSAEEIDTFRAIVFDDK